MSTREQILGKLRETLARPELPFPSPAPPALTDLTRLKVTQLEGDRWLLARRFGQELEALHGTFDIVETAVEARMATLNRITEWTQKERDSRKGVPYETGQERSVLSWAETELPLSGLGASLADIRFQLISPSTLLSRASRDAVRHITIGLTGVEAAFATTGSMLMRTAPGKSRAASLLPLRHLALIPLSRLYPTVEDWLAEQRSQGTLRSYLRENANVAMISGPSKSADIESNLTLGVHGPKEVHVILYDDLAALIRDG